MDGNSPRVAAFTRDDPILDYHAERAWACFLMVSQTRHEERCLEGRAGVGVDVELHPTNVSDIGCVEAQPGYAMPALKLLSPNVSSWTRRFARTCFTKLGCRYGGRLSESLSG